MIYRFEDCVLDTERYALRRAGEVIALERKVFEGLRYLLARRDRMVSRTELLEQGWPETFVSHETLTRCVSRVQQAIGRL
jgi:DNA-binding winged helix-turn-helix (wHTH) protein